MRGASPALTAVLTRAGTALLRAKAPGGRKRWERTNYAGRTVELYAGPASALAASVGAWRVRPAAGVVVVVAGLCGAYDDLAGDHRRGFRAHLGALRDGEVTSGAVKLFGISAAGLVAGALMKERALDKVLAGVVIAGTAHFVNLVDVRPGRAAGAVLALGVPGMVRSSELAGVAVGAAAAVLPDDLSERVMIGDVGAHALGAALGAAVVAGNARAGLLVHAAAAVAAAVRGDQVSRVSAAGRWGFSRSSPRPFTSDTFRPVEGSRHSCG
ncbi:UDP-N-acetylmuramyl pentapeptide phosphotransferase/UDP-N-acetylglucosamine-1-phosphate transferase [Streptomyces canus]